MGYPDGMSNAPDRDSSDVQIEASEDVSVAPIPTEDDWAVWPPSPRIQIVLIAIGFGLFNLVVIVALVWIMVRHFG